MNSGNRTIRVLVTAIALLTVLSGTATAAPLWEFKFNETGTSPANTGTGSPAPALVTKQAWYGSTDDLHGADGSGVSRQTGDRALDLSGISTNGGMFPSKSFPPQINVANASCTPIQNLTTLTLSGWFNAQAPITKGTYKHDARLITFNTYQIGCGVEFSTTDIAKNQIAVVLDAATLYFDVTAIMNFSDTNKWYFWAVTYDGTLGANNAKFYMGSTGSTLVQVGATQSANVGAMETTTANFSLNGDNGAGTLKGIQDNVRVDNVVMSLAELEIRRVTDAAADIALYGKGYLITNGDGTTTPTDGTDFGSVMPASIAVTNTFAISNSGSDILYLTSPSPITFSGHTSDFTVVTSGTSTNIAPNASTTFKVVFTPTTTGTRTGTVSLANNVASKNPYTFSIKGNGIGVEPVISLTGKGLAIGNGDLVPDSSHGTDFGGADILNVTLTNTFTITNAGLAPLTLTGGTPVTLTGDTGDFTVDTSGMSSSLGAGSSTSFRIVFDPAVAGTRTGLVSIASDDIDMNPFTFAVQGTGLKPVMAILGNGAQITPGDTTPASADATDFGGAALVGVAVTNTFTIANSGTAVLLLTGGTPVTITGHTTDFSVFANPSTNIATSASTTFKIVFDPTVIGIRTGVVSIANSDGDRNPYVFSIKGNSGVSTNTIPYSEPFESYPHGYPLALTNGWTAQYSTMAMITTNSYASGYAGAFPIPGPHTTTLQIDGRVTNSFAAAAHSNVWVDMILESKAWTNSVLPSGSLMPNAQFALCITTNHHLVVWNCPAPPNPTCAWTELLDTNLPEGSYNRITVQMAYIRDSTNYFHYRVWVNGIPSVNPSTWYAAANTNWNSLRKITAEGLFNIDDLTVQSSLPFPPVSILASSQGSGTILPTGTIDVLYGSTISFTHVPNTWYHLGDVTVDSVSAGTPSVYAFTNVIAGHTIQAVFLPDLVLSNTPNWWLAAANPAWTNNLSAASTNDQDCDGLFTWQEYIAGTHPTNPASTFSVQLTGTNSQWQISLQTIEPGPQYEGLSRYYSFESRNSLTGGTWEPVPGFTDIRSLGQLLICTNLVDATNGFYRAKVKLAP
jgi:hypothetical protein